MNAPNESGKYPPWGCLGWCCWAFWFLALQLLVAGCLQDANIKNEGTVETLVLGTLAFSLVSFYFLWPRLVRAGSEGENPPGVGKQEASPPSETSPTSFSAGGAAKGKGDDEFPWEAFAYGYLMHELLDDGPSDEEFHQADEGWGADAEGNGDYGEEYGEEYWGDDLFDS